MLRLTKVTLLSVLPLLVLVALCAIPAHAGMPNGVIVSVNQTGTGPGGKGLVSSAHGLIDAADLAYTQTFAEVAKDTYSNDQPWIVAWSGVVGDAQPYTVTRWYNYAGMKAFDFRVWNGSNMPGYTAEVTVSVLDPTWSRFWRVTVEDTLDGSFERDLRNGDSWTFSMSVPHLSSPNQFWGGANIAVEGIIPEPGSIAALFTGFVALGFVRRRR